jgi:hypothetical protein
VQQQESVSQLLLRHALSPPRFARQKDHLNIQYALIREFGALLDEGKARLGFGAHQPLDGFFGGVLRQNKYPGLSQRARAKSRGPMTGSAKSAERRLRLSRVSFHSTRPTLTWPRPE